MVNNAKEKHMISNLARYYKSWNSGRGANYFIFDRTTGDKVDECQGMEDAENRVRKLNEKDREERGLPPLKNAVETPSNYYGMRNRNEQSIEPMPVYK